MKISKTTMVSIGLLSTAAAGLAGTPCAGMTQREVLRTYGRPTQVSESNRDLQWIYIDLGGIGFLNPFHNPKVTTITFHRGKVASYTVDE